MRSRSSVARLAFILGAASRAEKNPPVNLNFPSAEHLQQVPGIGLATAKSIINFRKKAGRSGEWKTCSPFAESRSKPWNGCGLS